jgi:hypothetical protein
MAKDRWEIKPADPACTDPVDRDNVDLELLRPYIHEDDITRAVNSYIRAGGRELRGVRIYQESLEHLGVEYEKNRNPLYAWTAYRAAREIGCPVPDWALEYLEEAAEEICILRHRRGRVSHTDIAKAVKLAGTPGKKNAFSSYRNTKWRRHAKTVESNIVQGDKETYAIEGAAKQWGVSESTVRRAWKRYQINNPE